MSEEDYHKYRKNLQDTENVIEDIRSKKTEVNTDKGIVIDRGISSMRSIIIRLITASRTEQNSCGQCSSDDYDDKEDLLMIKNSLKNFGILPEDLKEVQEAMKQLRNGEKPCDAVLFYVNEVLDGVVHVLSQY